ncbi:MAG: hypothetical protein K9G13_02950, partial [Aquiluna sp.]|nr:hypothetical protein [Aquiluna sp.]MCF8545481.1 hypothetical protein [Aquiluna sp.]
MSKNTTRKGIAFGAMVALGASLFAGAPAQANSSGPLTLLPNGGTATGATYTSLIGAGLTLSSVLDADKQQTAITTFVATNVDQVTQAEYNQVDAMPATTDGEVAVKVAQYNDYAFGSPAYVTELVGLDAVNGIPGTWLSNPGATSLRGLVNTLASRNAIDPIADAYYLVSNPDGATIKLTADTETQGYYVYDEDGFAGGPATAGAEDATKGTLGIVDLNCGYLVGTTPTARACADSDDYGFLDEDKTFVDIGTTTYITNAELIAIKAMDATNTTVGNRTIEPLHIDAFDVDGTSAIELEVSIFTDNLDSSGDSDLAKLNNGEWTSATQDVTLLPASAVSVTTAMKASTTVRDADEIDATVTIGSNVNPHAVASKLKVLFYEDGTKVDLDTDATSPTTTDAVGAPVSAEVVVPTADATTGVITATGSRNGALISAVYTARALFSGTTTDIFVGARSVALDLRDGTNATVKSAKTVFTESDDVAVDVNNDAAVRAGVKTVTVVGQITKDTTALDATQVDYAAAGVRVSATVTGVAVHETSTITVAGSTAEIVEALDSITVFGYTNSDGEFPITISSTTGKNLDSVSVQFKALMAADGTYAGVAAENVTWETPALETDLEVSPSAYLTGETVNVTFTAVDQFGVGMDSTTTGRVSIRVDAYVDGAVKTATYSETKATTNGAASFSFANFATAGSDQEIKVTVFQASTPGVSAYYTVYNNVSTSAIAIADVFENRVQYVDAVTGKTSDVATLKSATDAGVIAAFGATAGTEYANIVGTALDANNAGQPGVPVTIAAEGVLFYDAETKTLALDSITVLANGQGFFDVKALSHKVNSAGATVTVTAGGVTETTLLKSYLATSISAANLELSWVLPAVMVKDTTYLVTAKLNDVWGNPIRTLDTTGDMNVYAEGALNVNGEPFINRNFGVTGEATFYVRSVATIGGPGTLGAALDASLLYATGKDATTGTVADADQSFTTDVTTTSWNETLWPAGALSVTVDVLDAAPAADQKVNAGSFKGYVALYAKGYKGSKMTAIVAGKWLAVN